MRIDVKFSESTTQIPVGFENLHLVTNGMPPGEVAHILKDCNTALETKGVDGAQTLHSLPAQIGKIVEGQWWLDWFCSLASISGLFAGAQIETLPDGMDFRNAINANSLFQGCQRLKSLPVINTTNATNVSYMFHKMTSADLAEVTVDIRSATTMDGMFSQDCAIPRVNFIGNCGKAVTTNNMFLWGMTRQIHAYEDETLAKEIPLDLSSNTSGSTFAYAQGLEYVRFAPGTIRVTMNISYCFKLTAESIRSVMNALADITGQTLTLSRMAVNDAFGSTESEQWLALVAQKPGWTIALV